MLRKYRSLAILFLVAIAISIGARIWLWYEVNFVEFSGPNIGIGGLALLGDTLIAITIITFLGRFLIDRREVKSLENRKVNSTQNQRPHKTSGSFRKQYLLATLFFVSIAVAIFAICWDVLTLMIFDISKYFSGLSTYGLLSLFIAIIVGMIWLIKALMNIIKTTARTSGK